MTWQGTGHSIILKQNTFPFINTQVHLSCLMAILLPCTPQNSKNGDNAAKSLRRMCTEIGIPVNLKSDLASSFTGRNTAFMQTIQKYGINITFSEKDCHNQLQQVDLAIRKLKQQWHQTMIHCKVPHRLWCYGLEHQAQVMNLIPQGQPDRSGYEVITGCTPDISEFCDFAFYDLIWYWCTSAPSLGDHVKELARWVGVAHGLDWICAIGSYRCQGFQLPTRQSNM